MRVRKKPDLRIQIPSYPHDYVQMPPETRRLILEANRSPNDIRYIDDDPSPTDMNNARSLTFGEIDKRPATPEVKIMGPNDMTLNSKGKEELNAKADGAVHKPIKRSSISLPDGLKDYEIEDLRKKNLNNVSRLNSICFSSLE